MAFVEALHRLGVQEKYHALLGDLTGSEAAYLPDIVAADLEGKSDAEGTAIAAPVARGIVRHLQAAKDPGAGAQPQSDEPAAEGEPLSLPEDPRDLKALREAVAAVGLPDEAMPGSRTDLLKLQAAADPDVVQVLAANLKGRSREAATSAAIIRSIAITPATAAALCDGGCAAALAATLRRPALTAGPVLVWSLPAIVQLAQFTDTHRRLVPAGVKDPLEVLARAGAAGEVRGDLLASLALGLLSNTGGPPLAMGVPLRAVKDIVQLLSKRCFAASAEEVVESRAFCGLGMEYHPRMILQCLTGLVTHSGAHRAMAWQTLLPQMLTGLLAGELPSTYGNEGSHLIGPSVVDLARACAETLLQQAEGESEAREDLQAALTAATKKRPAKRGPPGPPSKL